MLLGVGWLYVLLLMHQSGIARTSDVLEQSESIADILSGTHTAIFLVDMHGMVHTDEIGMHTVLYSLLRAPRRDAFLKLVSTASAPLKSLLSSFWPSNT